MLFSKIPGLVEIKKRLIHAVKNAHVAHAQLFVGQVGSANLALALAYAQFINCENPTDEDSCGICSSCNMYQKLAHPDLSLSFPLISMEKVAKEEVKSRLIKPFRELIIKSPYSSIVEWGKQIDSENKQFNIGIEEAKSMISAISLKSFQAEYKVVLIWLPELMNIQAANALLKILEEPPQKTLFFLVSNDHERLLSTINSRCQMTYVRAFEEGEIINYFVENQLSDARKASQVAKLASGNMNKAISLLSEDVNSNHELFVKWMRLCFSRKYSELLQLSEQLATMGRENQKNFLLYSNQVIRDVLMSKLDLFDLIKQDETELKFIQNFGKALKQEYINQMYEIFGETFVHIERNGNAKIIFLDTSLKISLLFER